MGFSERLRKATVSSETSVAGALEVMDESGDRIVFVVDPEDRLLGVMTDGDARRHILAARSLDEPVEVAMNATPITLPLGGDAEEVRELMISRRIECVPRIDESGRLLDAVWWLDLFEEGATATASLGLPVVVMAGGEGTRLSPFTNILPKPLMPLGERTILELIMERFATYGCAPFYLSVNYKAELIRAYLADAEVPWPIEYVREERPLGTAGSLALLKGRLDATFFLTNSDILVDADYADIVGHHRTSGNLITLVASMRHMAMPYGVCETGEGGVLVSITEKPEFDFLVNTGFYVIEPQALDFVPDDSPMHLTEVINAVLASGRSVGVYPVSARSWLDIGEFDSLQETLAHFGLG